MAKDPVMDKLKETKTDIAFWVDADKSLVCEVSEQDKGVYQFDVTGLSLLLKVGRWQLNGNREIWECRLDKGYRVAFNDFSETVRYYMVKNGLFRFELDGREFTTDTIEDDLVRVPAHTAYAFTALSEDCVIQDFHVRCHLFRLLEMLEAVRDYFPEKLKGRAYVDYLFEMNNVVAFESFKKVGAN